jgi:hypothetical protein
MSRFKPTISTLLLLSLLLYMPISLTGCTQRFLSNDLNQQSGTTDVGTAREKATDWADQSIRRPVDDLDLSGFSSKARNIEKSFGAVE